MPRRSKRSSTPDWGVHKSTYRPALVANKIPVKLNAEPDAEPSGITPLDTENLTFGWSMVILVLLFAAIIFLAIWPALFYAIGFMALIVWLASKMEPPEIYRYPDGSIRDGRGRFYM